MSVKSVGLKHHNGRDVVPIAGHGIVLKKRSIPALRPRHKPQSVSTLVMLENKKVKFRHWEKSLLSKPYVGLRACQNSTEYSVVV
jgi:hypothetical protein